MPFYQPIQMLWAETLDRVNGVTQNHLIVGWVKFKVKNIKYKTGMKTGNLSFSPE